MAISVHNTNRVKPKSSSQQFGEAFSRAATSTAQHLYEKDLEKTQQKNISKFLKDEYGIENAENVPAEFQMAAMKGAQSKQNRLAGKATQEEQLRNNEIYAKALRGDATPQEEASLPAEQQLQISKEKRNKKDEERKERLYEKLEKKGISSSQKEPNSVNPKSGEISVDLPTLMSEDDIFQAEQAGEHNLANQMRAHNKAIEDRVKHEENLQFKKDKESPEHKRETAMAAQQAQADVKYNTQLQESAGLAHIKTKTLTDLEKLNEKGVTGKPYEKLLEKFGLVNLTSEGRREFAADVKHMITDIRSILGGQFSNFEFQTILNAYPSADFSQGANRAIINNLKEFQDIKNKEIEFANQIKKNNGGKIPEDFQSLVNQKVNEYAQDRLPSIKANTRKVMHEEYGIPEGNYLMFDNNGEPLNVPEEMLEHYMELGASLP